MTLGVHITSLQWPENVWPVTESSQSVNRNISEFNQVPQQISKPQTRLLIALSVALISLGFPVLAQNTETPSQMPVVAPGPESALNQVSSGQQMIVIASGRTYGLMNLISATVCDLINNRRKNQISNSEVFVIPPCLLKPGGNSEQNLESLRRGDVTLAMVQGDWQYHAFNSTANYLRQSAFVSMRTVMAFTTKDLTFVTSPSSKASNFFDIRRQVTGVGTQSSGIDNLLKIVGAVVGWGEKDYGNTLNMSETDQLEALCSDEINVGLFMLPHPSKALESTMVRCRLNLLSISKTVVNTLILEVPYLIPVAVESENYSRLILDSLTIGLPIRLVGLDTLDPQIAYEIYKLVIENIDNIRSRHSFLSQLDPDEMAVLLGTQPVHAGVDRYLSEMGIDRVALNDRQLRNLGL